jgi:hypothetical protein
MCTGNLRYNNVHSCAAGDRRVQFPIPVELWGHPIRLRIMGKIGLAIVLAAMAAYAADQRWNSGLYTDSTLSVLRHAQHALGW